MDILKRSFISISGWLGQLFFAAIEIVMGGAGRVEGGAKLFFSHITQAIGYVCFPALSPSRQYYLVD